MFKKKYVTSNKDWKYLKLNKFFFISFLIYLIQKIIERVFSVKIIKKKNYNPISLNDRTSYSQNKILIIKRNKRLLPIMVKFLNDLNIHCSSNKIIKIINEHDIIFYRKNPIHYNNGGNGYNNSLFFYTFLKTIKKCKLVIESGVWKGYMSYVIDQIFNNSSKLKFDISFNKLIYKSPKSKYIEDDINTFNFQKFKNSLPNSIAFFDDHCSQLDRFLKCHNLKIPNMVFDDDVNFETIHSDGWPSFPTISMLRDNLPIKKFNWVHAGRAAKGNYKNKFNKKLLNNYYFSTAPNISRITGYYVQSPMTFIVKK